MFFLNPRVYNKYEGYTQNLVLKTVADSTQYVENYLFTSLFSSNVNSKFGFSFSFLRKRNYVNEIFKNKKILFRVTRDDIPNSA